MFESLPAPVACAVLDVLSTAVVLVAPDGQLLHANPPARRLMGDMVSVPEFNLSRLIEAAHARGAEVTVIRLAGSSTPEVLYPRSSSGAETLAARERRAILERLQATGWKLAESARQLGISRTTLWRRLRAYGLTRNNDMP
jgi:transcriptional regulator of acetoin/glycerol metabolism